MFNEPINKIDLGGGIFANKFYSGIVEIDGNKFIGYNLKEAIRIWRGRNKKTNLKKILK